MTTQPDSLTIAQLQRRLDAALEANALLGDSAMGKIGIAQRLETEIADYRALKLAERNAAPSHDPRLPLLTEVVDTLGAMLRIAPARLPIAPDAVPEAVQPLHTD